MCLVLKTLRKKSIVQIFCILMDVKYQLASIISNILNLKDKVVFQKIFCEHTNSFTSPVFEGGSTNKVISAKGEGGGQSIMTTRLGNLPSHISCATATAKKIKSNILFYTQPLIIIKIMKKRVYGTFTYQGMLNKI